MFTEKFYGNVLKEVLYLDKNDAFITGEIDEDHRAGIRYAIADTGLSEQQLVLLNLRFGCSMSYKECGDVTGISATKARGLIITALNNIRMSSSYVYLISGFSEGERMDHYVDSIIKKQQDIATEGGYEDFCEEIGNLETRFLVRFGISKDTVFQWMSKGYHTVADLEDTLKTIHMQRGKDTKLLDEFKLFHDSILGVGKYNS